MTPKAARSILLSRYQGTPCTKFPMIRDNKMNAAPSMTAQRIPLNRFSHSNGFILFKAILVNIKKPADKLGLLARFLRAGRGLPAVGLVGGVIEL